MAEDRMAVLETVRKAVADGDVDLGEGHVAAAAAAYEHAYALSIQLGDPCWEGLALRGIGLVADQRGDAEAAVRWVAEARSDALTNNRGRAALRREDRR